MSSPLELRRVPAPAVRSDTVLVVSDALLALMTWRDVSVVREVRQELTRLERFLLETALALGKIDAATFDEIVSLPRGVLAGGMSRLVGGGAARLAGDEFYVDAEVAARFLANEVVIREVPSCADFALLPRSGDLFAVESSGSTSWLRELELARLAPVANAPVPRELWGQRRHAYLARRMRDGSVGGLPTDVLRASAPEIDPPLTAVRGDQTVCPAFRCTAEVRRGGDGELLVDATLHGESMRRRGRSPEADDADGAATVALDLSDATQLVESWLRLPAVAFEDPATLRDAWRCIGPAVIRRERPVDVRRGGGPGLWEFPLRGDTARAIAGEGRALTQPVGLTVGGEEAVVTLACTFTPADDEARALFARDIAAASLLGSDEPAADLENACRAARAGLPAVAPALSASALRERIWELKWYRLAYALRETEDFVHD